MSDADFLSYIDHTPEDLETAKIEVAELQRIHDDHEGRQDDLRDVGETIQRALTRFPGVHSTRVRVKSPRSLVHKVVRKRIDDPERNITLDTYKDEIRDLIGLRALHLFKEDWQAIHQAVIGKWNLHPEETPLAYLREGDSEALETQLKEAGFEVKKKGGGYRSLHFIVQSQFDKSPCYAEIQVRTLFEEAWGEVDHQVRYPDHEDDELLSDYLLILNRLAGGADEMASLLLRIKSAFDQLRVANGILEQTQTANAEALQKLKEENEQFVDQLKISEAKKDELKRRLDQSSESVTSARRDLRISPGALGGLQLSAILAGITSSNAASVNAALASVANITSANAAARITPLAHPALMAIHHHQQQADKKSQSEETEDE